MDLQLTVYLDPDNPDCTATLHALDGAGLLHHDVDITRDSAARTQLFHEGWRDLPVVTIGAAAWSGHRPDRIRALTRLRDHTTAPLVPVDPNEDLQCDSCQ